MNPFLDAILLVLSTAFDCAVFVFCLRFLFQLHKVDFYNPYSQFLVTCTNPFIQPLRRCLTSRHGTDIATVIVIAFFLTTKLCLFFGLTHHALPHLVGTMLWVTGEFFSTLLSIYFYALLLQAILSWISQSFSNPINVILFRLTSPLLNPIRKRMPMINGLDLSIIPAMLLIKLTDMLLITPLIRMGQLQL